LLCSGNGHVALQDRYACGMCRTNRKETAGRIKWRDIVQAGCKWKQLEKNAQNRVECHGSAPYVMKRLKSSKLTYHDYIF